MTTVSPAKSAALSPWSIVWLCFFALAISASARVSIGLAMPAWEKDFGWSRSFTSGGAALALMVMALISPVVGNLVGRVGPRQLLSVGLIASGLGLGLLAAFPSQATFILGFSVLGGLGFGTSAIHLVTTVIAGNFDTRRGLATGVGTAGSTGGQLLLVPMISWLLAQYSWRVAFMAIAVALIGLALTIRLVLKPEPMEAAKAAAQSESIGYRLLDILKNPIFHVLFWSFFICGITTSGAIEVHFLPYAAFCGFPPVTSSIAFGLLAAVNMLGMIGSGWLCDRVNRPLLLGSIYIARGLSYLLLLYVGVGVEYLFLFAVVFGLFDYSTVPPTAGIVASRLGLQRMGLAMGLISGGHSLGGALGAYAGGRLFDFFARYSEFWVAAFVVAIAAGFLCWTLKEVRTTSEAAPAH